MKNTNLCKDALLHRAKDLYYSLERVIAAFESDAKISPNMPIIISVETNSAAMREAKEILDSIVSSDDPYGYKEAHREITPIIQRDYDEAKKEV